MNTETGISSSTQMATAGLVVLTGEGGSARPPAPGTPTYIQRPEIFTNAAAKANPTHTLTQPPESPNKKEGGRPAGQAAPSAAQPSPHCDITQHTHPARTAGITHTTTMPRNYLLITKGDTSLLQDFIALITERGHEIHHASEKNGDALQIAIGTPTDRIAVEASLPTAQESAQEAQAQILQKLDSIEQHSRSILEAVSKKEGRGDKEPAARSSKKMPAASAAPTAPTGLYTVEITSADAKADTSSSSQA